MQVQQGLLQAAVTQVLRALRARGTWMVGCERHHAGLRECVLCRPRVHPCLAWQAPGHCTTGLHAKTAVPTLMRTMPAPLLANHSNPAT